MNKLAQAENEKRAVLVFFHAQWCGACQHTKQKLMADIRRASAQNNVEVVEADVDEVPDVSSEMGITAMPTFQLWVPQKTSGKLCLKKKTNVIVGADGSAVQRLVAQNQQ